MTIKDYRIKGGLSNRIHNFAEKDEYKIKGPMGKGLQL
jgi:NAD(P)H-flavin reductase